MLYSIVLVSAIRQHGSATGKHMSLPSWISLPSPTPATPLGCHRALNWAPCVSFTYGNGYVSVLFSQFVPLSPPPTVFTSLFSMSASPLLQCKWVHQYRLSRLHTHALIYNICLSLFDLLHPIVGSRFIHLIRTDLNAFFFIVVSLCCYTFYFIETGWWYKVLNLIIKLTSYYRVYATGPASRQVDSDVQA